MAEKQTEKLNVPSDILASLWRLQPVDQEDGTRPDVTYPASIEPAATKVPGAASSAPFWISESSLWLIGRRVYNFRFLV